MIIEVHNYNQLRKKKCLEFNTLKIIEQLNN